MEELEVPAGRPTIAELAADLEMRPGEDTAAASRRVLDRLRLG